MKVLWITNRMFSHHFEMMSKEIPASSSGSWLFAAYEGAKRDKNIELHIATVSDVTKIYSGNYENVNFYILPGGSMHSYDIDSDSNISSWKYIKDSVCPDVVIVWGSESRFAYLAMRVLDNCPKIIYVQGVMDCIVQHLQDGIPHRTKYHTIRDFAEIINLNSMSKNFSKQVILEHEMFKMAAGVIVENDWCESQCLSMNSGLTVFYNKLPIRKEFFDSKWRPEKVELNTIFTNAGGFGYKGHHILFQALAIVKKSIPDVKLYIPGGNYMKSYNRIKTRSGYISWLHQIYCDNRLDENIIFTGVLDSSEMACYLEKCNLFVLPSMVENHSSSLIEAMIVGCPCISSVVGGAPSIMQHGYNGMLYNSLEYTTLAGYIISLLNDFEHCKLMANNALKIRENRQGDFGKEMLDIYSYYNKK